MSKTILTAIVLSVGTVWAQSGTDKLKFEVASVKPAAPIPGAPWTPVTGGPGTNDPVRITCRHVSLQYLLVNFYGFEGSRITGQALTNTGNDYDIVATMPVGTTKDQLNVMMQNLLKERLHLTLHREARELPVYELVLGKDGPKLKNGEEAVAEPPGEPKKTVTPALSPGGFRVKRDPDGFPSAPPGGTAYIVEEGVVQLNEHMQPISKIVPMLEKMLDRPVLDKTGLMGKYDVKIKFSNIGLAGMGKAGDAPGGGKTLFAVLEDQLGLKLIPAKGPVDFLVIDRVDKTPTGN